MSEADATAARRTPSQARSRERLECIQAAACELIVRTGSDQVKMSEVAALAGISIGSLYQYFPDKSALIRSLAERYNAESRRCIEEALAEVVDLPGLLAAFDALVDIYFEVVMAEPVMRDIWSGMQADKQLLALQLAEGRVQGALLAHAMREVHPGVAAETIDRCAFLVWELGEATVRLAISVEPEEGRALVEIYKRMGLREVAEPGS
jgi:AcrR family transcriptional regulator